jgi:hypothetical protein
VVSWYSACWYALWQPMAHAFNRCSGWAVSPGSITSACAPTPDSRRVLYNASLEGSRPSLQTPPIVFGNTKHLHCSELNRCLRPVGSILWVSALLFHFSRPLRDAETPGGIVQNCTKSWTDAEFRILLKERELSLLIL